MAYVRVTPTPHPITLTQAHSVIDTIGYFIYEMVQMMDKATFINNPTTISLLDMEIAAVICFEMWMFMEDLM